MIISREHRYVFVELPRTGSTAVQKELLHNYAGERVLQKHATYRDYLKQAADEEKRYFAFSSIRNPLDDAVSRYYKLKTDHHGRYTDPIRLKYRVGRRGAERLRLGEFPENKKLRRRSLYERLENRKYRIIQDDDLDFSTFFLRFYRAPYDNWSRLDHERLDYVIRFENLEEDFTTVLKLIGLEPKRSLPRLNRTAERPGTFMDEFSPAAIRRATWVFGPYMERWGYDLPAGWESASIHPSSRLAFQALAGPRRLYWQRLRAA